MSKFNEVLSSTNNLNDKRQGQDNPSLRSHDNFKSITATFLYCGVLVSFEELTAIFAFSKALKGA